MCTLSTETPRTFSSIASPTPKQRKLQLSSTNFPLWLKPKGLNQADLFASPGTFSSSFNDLILALFGKDGEAIEIEKKPRYFTSRLPSKR
jgi:hypothetical protein